MIKKEWQGFLAVLGAAFLWGMSGTVAKIMYHNEISPYLLVQVRMLWSSAVLWVFLYFNDKEALRIDKKDIPYFMVLGMPVLALLQFTYLFTISQTNVGTAIFLQYFAPIFITLFMLITKKEAWSFIKIFALVLAFAGCFLVLFGKAGLELAVNIPGLISGFASAALFAIYTIYNKHGLEKYKALTVLTYAMTLGACFWNILMPLGIDFLKFFGVFKAFKLMYPWEVFTQNFPRSTYAFFIYIAVFSAVLPYGLYIKSVSLILPSTASIIALTEPLFAMVAAYVILNEKMTLLQILGGFFVISAIAALQYFESRGK